MMSGYKETEVGPIPEDWKVVPLSELAEIRSGIAKNSNTVVGNPVLVHYLRVANVQDGFLDLSEMSQLRVSRDDVKRFAVVRDDVLMNEGGDLDKLGRGALWGEQFSPCIHQNHVFVVRCGSALFPRYLNAWTRAMPARRFFLIAGKQTTNLASINKTSLGQLPVAIPPAKAEQEAIAAALCDADALIESLEQLLAKKRNIKQGAMQELLTGKRRLPGFIGAWKVVPLGRVASFRTGPFGSALHKSDYIANGVPIVNPMHIVDGQIVPSMEMTVTQQAAKRLEDFRLRNGDIIIGRRGDMGRCAVVTAGSDGWLCGTGSLIIRCEKDAVSSFVQRMLSSEEIIAAIEEAAVGTTMINLNQKTLRAHSKIISREWADVTQRRRYLNQPLPSCPHQEVR